MTTAFDSETDAQSDLDLVALTRSGDTDAFGELWTRHHRAGIAVARSITSSLDADDLVQEAYARIYQSILAGNGPTGAFRAYLFTTIRRTAATWGAANRTVAVEPEDLDQVADPIQSEHETDEGLDRSLTHRAFSSLPTRWQEVLWYSEIEGMKPTQIAPLLGMSARAVAQLTFRAREGLRESWIQAHLRSLTDGSDCQWTVEHLGAYSRGNSSARDRNKIEKHLGECARCTIVAAEAGEVSNRLALVLLPLTVGAAGAAGYLAFLQTGALAGETAAAGFALGGVAEAAAGAPDAVAGVVSGIGVAGVGAAAGGSAGGSGAGAGAGASAIWGAVAGITALVGVAAAGAFVIAGVFTPPADQGPADAANSSQQNAAPEAMMAQQPPADTPVAPDAPQVPPVAQQPPVAPDQPTSPLVLPSTSPSPSAIPTLPPTVEPSVAPTREPSTTPSATPTNEPSTPPSVTPTPTSTPTSTPTPMPTPTPTVEPTLPVVTLELGATRTIAPGDQAHAIVAYTVSGEPGTDVEVVYQDDAGTAERRTHTLSADTTSATGAFEVPVASAASGVLTATGTRDGHQPVTRTLTYPETPLKPVPVDAPVQSAYVTVTADPAYAGYPFRVDLFVEGTEGTRLRLDGTGHLMYDGVAMPVFVEPAGQRSDYWWITAEQFDASVRVRSLDGMFDETVFYCAPPVGGSCTMRIGDLPASPTVLLLTDDAEATGALPGGDAPDPAPVLPASAVEPPTELPDEQATTPLDEATRPEGEHAPADEDGEEAAGPVRPEEAQPVVEEQAPAQWAEPTDEPAAGLLADPDAGSDDEADAVVSATEGDAEAR